MFGTLLTWMQDHSAPIFLIATANNIDQLPPELMRKGRFDEIFFVDLPGPADRETIFAIHLRKHRRDKSQFDVARLVDRLRRLQRRRDRTGDHLGAVPGLFRQHPVHDGAPPGRHPVHAAAVGADARARPAAPRLGQLPVRAGRLRVVSGQWSVASGQWSVASGQWPVNDA